LELTKTQPLRFWATSPNHYHIENRRRKFAKI